MKRANLKVGQRVAHYGTNENANTLYTGTILYFDQAAIRFKNDNGQEYWLNAWNLVKAPKH